MLSARTGKPAQLMSRGIDCNAFSPGRRRRNDRTFVIGYVGRLMIEKGVRFFEKLEKFLEDHGVGDFRIEMIGWGSQ